MKEAIGSHIFECRGPRIEEYSDPNSKAVPVNITVWNDGARQVFCPAFVGADQCALNYGYETTLVCAFSGVENVAEIPQIDTSILYESKTTITRKRFKNGQETVAFKVAKALIEEINRGVYRDQLPPMEVLAQKHDVGRLSVYNAIHMLQEEGIVKIRQGRGTFITRVRD